MSTPQQTSAFSRPGDHLSSRHMLGGGLSRRILRKLLSSLDSGKLTVHLPNGKHFTHEAARPGPDAVLVLHRWRALRQIVFKGSIGFADAYIDGDWSTPDLTSLIELAARNLSRLRSTLKGSLLARSIARLRHARRANTRRGARANILAHYDLGNEFYRHWLDTDMSYSSAVFLHEQETLEEAQRRKQDRVLANLDLHGGEHVLEIGIGWGGLAARLLERGCRMTGLTLSPAQLDHAKARLERDTGRNAADLRLQDYRDVKGTFDRIVSIEMFEAVGQAYWPDYFSALRERLARSGVAVLQIITIAEDRFRNYQSEVDFIQRYIFPGGMLPSPSILRKEIEGAGLTLSGVDTFGQSYARTLAHWQQRFQAAWPKIERLGFDMRFKRMWEYYLSYCEAGFRAGAIDVGLYRVTHAGVEGVRV